MKKPQISYQIELKICIILIEIILLVINGGTWIAFLNNLRHALWGFNLQVTIRTLLTLNFVYRAHPFAKKEWYNVLAPGFDKRNISLTPCNKTAGLVHSADSLKDRVFSISLADCNNSKEAEHWRKLKFQVAEIKGFDCYTNFHGMDITRDKACSMVKKWHSLIEAFVQAKTTDGYILRMFCIAFTKKTHRQVKATCYAKASHQKLIRKKMMEIMQSTIQKSTLKDLVKIL